MFATLRKAYEKVLTLADRPWAEKALAGLSFAEASFFPIPPDPLLLAMGAGRPDRALRFAMVTTLASVAGALFGWLLGAFLMDTVGAALLDLYDGDRVLWGKVEVWYAEWGVAAVVVAALTPIPFKVFTIASGALGLPLAPFLAACAAGRGIRFGAEGILLRLFGAKVKNWMDRWFEWGAVIFAVLLVGGFLLLGALE